MIDKHRNYLSKRAKGQEVHKANQRPTMIERLILERYMWITFELFQCRHFARIVVGGIHR